MATTWHKDNATAWWYEADIIKSCRMPAWHYDSTDSICCCCWMPLMMTSTLLLWYRLNSLCISQFSKCQSLLFSVLPSLRYVFVSCLLACGSLISYAVHVEHCSGVHYLSHLSPTSWLCDETRVWRVDWYIDTDIEVFSTCVRLCSLSWVGSRTSEVVHLNMQ